MHAVSQSEAAYFHVSTSGIETKWFSLCLFCSFSLLVIGMYFIFGSPRMRWRRRSPYTYQKHTFIFCVAHRFCYLSKCRHNFRFGHRITLSSASKQCERVVCMAVSRQKSKGSSVRCAAHMVGSWLPPPSIHRHWKNSLLAFVSRSWKFSFVVSHFRYGTHIECGCRNKRNSTLFYLFTLRHICVPDEVWCCGVATLRERATDSARMWSNCCVYALALIYAIRRWIAHGRIRVESWETDEQHQHEINKRKKNKKKTIWHSNVCAISFYSGFFCYRFFVPSLFRFGRSCVE